MNPIQDVTCNELPVFPNPAGDVMRLMRVDSPEFVKFGEVYFSRIKQGAVKAWKRHTEMTLNLAVPMGSVRFVIYDVREGSSTKGEVNEYVIGESDYRLLTIPPGVWFGFQGVGESESLIANCADMMHVKEEAETVTVAEGDFIPFSWE